MASTFVDLKESPRALACYDLVKDADLASPRTFMPEINASQSLQHKNAGLP